MDCDDNKSENFGESNDRTKADVLSSFILHAPPGAFHEVLNDIKDFMPDNDAIQKKVSKVFPVYTKSQLTPVLLDESSTHKVIISDFNDIDGRFVDPRTKQSFLYDHVTGIVSDLKPWEPDSVAEPWRSALETDLTLYSLEHYHEGAASVFSSSSSKTNTITLNLCLEGHQFQPKKFWNGRWRSTWTMTFDPKKDKQVEMQGLIKLHVHYYEDGNVQLVSSRNCDQQIDVSKSPSQFANSVVAAIEKFENCYQRAISENYQTMSDTTFKALRRPLPVIRSKMEWNKIMGYKIGSELKNHHS